MSFRVAIVGVGGMGACHARHLHELSGVEVAWVADPDQSAGTALALEVDATWSADGFEAMVDADGLIIAAPDRFHFGYAEAALDRGIPTLCEKPLTEQLADAKLLVDRETERGRRLIQVGFMREYDEPHRQVVAALADLGPVNHVRSVHRNRNADARSLPEIFVSSIIHDIHSVRFLSGAEIVSVSADVVERDGRTRFVLLTCRLDNGGLATIEFDDFAAGYEVWVEVDTERGHVTSAAPGRALVKADGTMGSMIGNDWFAPFLGTYRVEIQAWLAASLAGSVVGPSAWDGFAAQVAIEAAVESARSGRPEPVVLPTKPEIYRRETP